MPISQIAINIVIAAFVIFVLMFALVWALFYFMQRRKTRFREERSLNSTLLLISVSRENEIKIDAMEQLINALFSIKEGGWKTRFQTQPVVSFEIVAKKETIKFYVWTHNEFKDLIEKQIHGVYPEADIEEVDEYEIFDNHGKVEYKAYQLKKEVYKPLKSYKELPNDPLQAITSALAKMGEGESAAIQILISPYGGEWGKLGRNYVSETKKAQSDPEKNNFSANPKELEAIENKSSKPGFETSIRIVVVAPTDIQAKSHLANIDSAFSLFNSEFNSFSSLKIRNKGSFVEDFIYRYHPMWYLLGNKHMILTAEEISTIFHFPNKLVTTPYIHWLLAKRVAAPAKIATEGTFIGNNKARGQVRPVFMQTVDRRRHMYIIGKTGTGKTEFLKGLIMQDIKNGNGLCFIDPHGDAVEDIMNRIPAERAEDVIYFRPSDLERPFGLNLLEAKSEDQKHFVTTAIINLMYKLFDPYKTGIVGPRFEHAVRNAMLTVMYEPGTSFIEVMRVLTDSNYVKELLPKVTDPIVRRYWTDQIAQTSDFHKSETLDYITSKFGRFVTNKMIRNMIGQTKSAFDFRDVMDNQKILLVNLSKGEMGEENSSFIGLILVPRILMAAMARTDMPEDQRKDFFLYVDEFQNFATPDFAQILSEARKYRLSLIVANQFISQMDDEIKGAVFGNVGTMCSFRVGMADASHMASEYGHGFTESDFQNIEKYNIYMKTQVKEEPMPPFSVDLTIDYSTVIKQRNPERGKIIEEMSRLKYGRDVRIVESEIQRRSKL